LIKITQTGTWDLRALKGKHEVMAECPFAGYKGIWEFSEWLHLFLASNVYGNGWSPSRIGRFNPGYMSLPTH